MTPKEIIAQIIEATEVEAKKHLPGYVQLNWITALSDLLEMGLYHAWLEVIENMQLVQLEGNEITIVDKRGEDDASASS